MSGIFQTPYAPSQTHVHSAPASLVEPPFLQLARKHFNEVLVEPTSEVANPSVAPKSTKT